VGVVELLEFAQCMQQVLLVPDQGPAEQLAAAGLHPPFDDGVGRRRRLHLIQMISTGVSG
jgi:hypothetical protein